MLRLPPAVSWMTAILSVGAQTKYSGNLAGRNIEVANAVGFAPNRMWQSVVDTTRTTMPPTAALCAEAAPTATFCVVPGFMAGNAPPGTPQTALIFPVVMMLLL